MRKMVEVASVLLGLLLAWVTMLIAYTGSGLGAALISLIGVALLILVLAGPTGGRAGLEAFLGSLLKWKVPSGWYLGAVLVPLSVQLAGLALFCLGTNLWLPLDPAYWNWAYLADHFQKILFATLPAVVFAGFVLRQTEKGRGDLSKWLIFCLSLMAGMGVLILGAVVSILANIWLFVGLIPAAYVAQWIYERSGRSLLIAWLFVFAFLALELLTPANWLLTGGFPEAMALSAALYVPAAALIFVADRRGIFTSGTSNLPAGGDDRARRGTVTLGSLILVATIVAGISLLCVLGTNGNLSYPEPTGPYKVGKVAYDWVDPNRTELATGGPTDRELLVYLWYPADVPENAPESPAMDRTAAEALRTGEAFSLGFLGGASDHTFQSAPVSGAQPSYPVLVMSHGDGSSPLLLSVTATELASHGYVVAGVSHTYNARATVFPDGRIVRRDYNYSLVNNDFNFSQPYYENAKTWAAHNAEVESREAADVSFVLDKIGQLNQSDSRFRGKIDLGRVGTLGYSLGGAVAVTSAERDSRIKAAADMDGAVYHNVSIQKPTLSFFRGSLLGYDRPYDLLNQRLLTPDQFAELKQIWDGYEDQVYTSPPTAYYVGIKGTEHGNFNDLGTLGVPVNLGHLDGRYATRIVDAYLVAFFDEQLNGTASPLLSGTQGYPEVVFKGHVAGVPVAG